MYYILQHYVPEGSQQEKYIGTLSVCTDVRLFCFPENSVHYGIFAEKTQVQTKHYIKYVFCDSFEANSKGKISRARAPRF